MESALWPHTQQVTSKGVALNAHRVLAWLGDGKRELGPCGLMPR